MMNFVEALKSLSLLVFQKETLVVCSVSNQIYKKIASISNMINVPGKSYSKFYSDVIVEDGNKPIFRGVNLADRAGLRTTRQTRLMNT